MYREFAEPRFTPTWATPRPRPEVTETEAPMSNRTRGEEELAVWAQHAMAAGGFGDAA